MKIQINSFLLNRYESMHTDIFSSHDTDKIQQQIANIYLVRITNKLYWRAHLYRTDAARL